MRPFFLALLMIAATPAAFAQGDSVQTHKVDERIMFQSNVRQLTSYLKENNERAAGTMFKVVSEQMQSFIEGTSAAIDTASGSEKRKLKGTLENQRQLIARFKSFEPNLLRNRSSIETWAEQFIKTLYPEG